MPEPELRAQTLVPPQQMADKLLQAAVLLLEQLEPLENLDPFKRDSKLHGSIIGTAFGDGNCEGG
ncbi:MAG: hypothetical protein WBE76_31140 [Terracidiphilus sp.]